MSSNTHIRLLEKPTVAEQDAIIDMVMAAFAQDPFVSAGTGGQLSNLPIYRAFTACFVRGAAVDGEIWVAELDGQVVGTSIWFPPGKDFMGSEEQRQAVKLEEYLGMLKPEVAEWFMGSLIPTVGGWCAESLGGEKAREQAQHLQILGVAPSYQRRGLGRALLEAGAKRGLENGKRVVWETYTAGNLAWYKSIGAVARGKEGEFESKFEGTKFPGWVLELPEIKTAA
ncbi:hypothetical protein CALCODRAFT_499063 [Calocera cornea HHB12733]|uniref:N-acetyltransferase domain-containing protein n=1 Tax=Calocera cornea HHB12733 TaxID=1353952 RepID=A0A165ELP8_9BASI|nr:hypothetical protein CALCODRAFT_499063 [Calocera cornea HHB12733]